MTRARVVDIRPLQVTSVSPRAMDRSGFAGGRAPFLRLHLHAGRELIFGSRHDSW